MDDQTLGKDIVVGAVSGAAATIPMTWAMEIMHRMLPTHERRPLPPRQITDRLMREIGINDQLSQEQRLWIALTAHMSYGATMGAAYAALARRLPGQPLTKGAVAGLAVWAGSYLGLMPALGLLTPATEHPPRRTALMIVAHLVWGSAVSIFVDLMESNSRREHPESLGAGKPGEPSAMQHA